MAIDPPAQTSDTSAIPTASILNDFSTGDAPGSMWGMTSVAAALALAMIVLGMVVGTADATEPDGSGSDATGSDVIPAYRPVR